MRSLILMMTLVMMAFSQVHAKPKRSLKKIQHSKIKRKLAHISASDPYKIELQYRNQKELRNFRGVQLGITPFTRYLTFTSFDNKRYLMDCDVTEDYEKWECRIMCEGGSLIVNFTEDKGFKEISIEPFRIRPRLCDGSESADDKFLRIRSKRTYTLIE